MRATGGVRAVVVVTTDKCYENREWPWGYRESDALGGHDPYSSSKAAAELAIACSGAHSSQSRAARGMASARAGNVIGGGDWAPDRIVPDFVRGHRRRTAAGPAQPGGYAPVAARARAALRLPRLGARLLGADGQAFAEAWNFGPPDDSVVTVGELAQCLVAHWGSGEIDAAGAPDQHLHEAGLLKLDCSKARARLAWHGAWGLDETIRATVGWYRAFAGGAAAATLLDEQLDTYVAAAARQKLAWLP